MLDTIISVDVKSNNDGTYDTYIATENSSGSHYPAIDANKIGEYVADLIDTLEEEDSGKSYLTESKSYLVTCFDKTRDIITSVKTFNDMSNAYDYVIAAINDCYEKNKNHKSAVTMKKPLLDDYDGPVAAYENRLDDGRLIEFIWNITKI